MGAGRLTGPHDLLRLAAVHQSTRSSSDEAADVAGCCGGGLGDPILANHKRIPAHLEKRAERILPAETGEGR
jgi:hypothetical protein